MVFVVVVFVFVFLVFLFCFFFNDTATTEIYTLSLHDALPFWIISAGLLLVLGWLLRVSEHRPNMEFMLPHRGAEIAVWIALSITAGICEETVFRGYLQRQFMALTKSVPAGILL